MNAFQASGFQGFQTTVPFQGPQDSYFWRPIGGRNTNGPKKRKKDEDAPIIVPTSPTAIRELAERLAPISRPAQIQTLALLRADDSEVIKARAKLRATLKRLADEDEEDIEILLLH